MKAFRFVLLTVLLAGLMGTVSAQGGVFDFESGSLGSGWSGDTGDFSVDSGTVAEGNYSLKFSYSGDTSRVISNSVSNSNPSSMEFYIWTPANPQFTKMRVRYKDSGSRIFQVENQPNTDYMGYCSTDQNVQLFDPAGSSWYHVELNNIDWGNNKVGSILVNGTQQASNVDFCGSRSSSGIDEVEAWSSTGGGNNGFTGYYDFIRYQILNYPPSFDSVSTDPSSWSLNSDIDVDANVSDSDGSVQSVTADVWENGTQIVSGQSLTNNSGTWEVDNLFTVDESDVYYNLSLTATDDDGATQTYEEDQFISDNPPSISLNDPGNESFFDYDVPVSFDVSDSDDVNDETYSCTGMLDNSQIFSETLLENGTSSYSDTFRADLGQHKFNVTCSDDAGNTATKTENFTVDNFNFTDLSGSSNAFETVDESFKVKQKIGSMVDNVSYRFVYDGNNITNKTKSYNSVTTDSQTFKHELPLVNSDNTDKDYFVNATVNYKTETGSNTLETLKTSNNTQTVDQAYKFGNHSLEDGFTQLEASDLEYTATVDKKTGNAQGSLSGETEFKQTNTVESLTQGTGLNYSSSFESEFVSSSSQSFDLVTDFTLEFDGDSRSFTGTKAVTLEKINLSTNSNDGAEALRLETKNEVNDSSINSDVQIGVNLANPDRPEKERFFGFDVSGSSSHSFYLSPSDAEVIANARSEENIVYQDTDGDFAERRHFLIDERLNNQTTIVNLYLLSLSDSASVTLELIDSDFNAVSGHVVRVERNFPNLNSSKIVDMTLTGSEGKGKIEVDPDEQYIFTVFNEEGDLVEQIGPQQITSNQVQLQLSEESEPNLAELVNGLKVSDVALSTTEASLDYVSETERLNNISLVVKKNSVFENTVVAQDSSTDLQGQLTASGFNSTENKLFYEVKARFGDTSEVIDTGRFGSNNGKYGDVGIFFSILMFVTITFAGLWRPTAAIAMGAVGLIVLSPVMLGFIPLTGSSLIAVVALAALLVWRMSS